MNISRRLFLRHPWNTHVRRSLSRFFIGYVHLLVYVGVFDVIEMHFGLKGHTHDGEYCFRKVTLELTIL